MRLLKNYLLPILILANITANAQFKKGDKMAGASVAAIVFNSGSSDISVANIGDNKSKNTNYSINISPSLGWFVSENTAVGFSLNINPTSQKVTYEQTGSTYQSDKASNFNIGVGGFARNYFSKGGSLLPFGQASVNAGISSYKEEGFFYGGSGGSAYKQTYDGSSSGGFFANATFTGGFTKMMGENAGA
ncbi:MAG: hypothetical protein IPM85_02190 [Chitinophagaceae bacterium]|nr:hypothetical protein [Chitinophagaceae bacterium]